MKVILNSDVKYLGEEGDVKVVANGYARNYLFPRNLALPYNNMTVAYFESRKEEIEAKKVAKRQASASLKEKLEAYSLTITMPAGVNGKLYGAVTTQTIADALNKDGFEIERKRIEIPGLTIKTIGKYSANVRLYESEAAQLTVHVVAQEQASKEGSNKVEAKPVEAKKEPEVVTEETTESSAE